MCGIAGIMSLTGVPVDGLAQKLRVMNALIAHRGPDGQGIWLAKNHSAGLAHRRLSIIDLSEHGAQPMIGADGSVITFNGEIYNYLELRETLRTRWDFRSHSDTETILAAHSHWQQGCLDHLQGMYSFAIWRDGELLAARDPFGIKPFYYAEVAGTLYFASEIKALLPFLPEIETDADALAEYLTFQYQIGSGNLFRHVQTLLPGHRLRVANGRAVVERYWDVHYDIDYNHTSRYFEERLREIVAVSMERHMRSDVPVGAYISGGIDSSLIAALASDHPQSARSGFHGKFLESPAYDESRYAAAAAEKAGIELHQAAITADDFRNSIFKVMHHLDHPVAGPGSFPQYMVSELAAKHVKVVLGGQGGDEIFGGYARYLVAYLEQALKASINGTYRNGNFVVTPESIIPNLAVLQEYVPLLRQFMAEGLFGNIDERYFRLVGRSNDMQEEVDWRALDMAGVMERYKGVFNSVRNVRKEAYFDSMTHFDFKCLLPALLQVEDRMSMAHGLEARVPLLDRDLVEFAATIPADIKFPGGRMKHLLKEFSRPHLPEAVMNRRDKMGFPVPLKEWFSGPLRDFVQDIFSNQAAKSRSYLDNAAILKNFDAGGQFSRKTWGLLSLEIWHQLFHDRSAEYQNMVRMDEIVAPAA
ncbi:asparagine synthase (glutamine-hydrolyzing) [Aureimonas leprariae]|uniref:asparagine synthase (glutamine-hydrolyzing) n=1 Tax=Plantimonas leprariae TaxID=2615207 RepID=A0A7V7PK15_9HYPH|nr:asparagine synthase (glutamine-hydrolyzing) [Aureimonas leprariae]KAB0675904.1 asparagine synthase (glutamine-hydrolyzing) [Aureimonas leprariae]